MSCVDTRYIDMFERVRFSDPYSVHVVVEVLKFLGRHKVILMIDGEPAIKALAEAAARQIGTGANWSTRQRRLIAPAAEQPRVVLEVARQVRTLVHAVETKYRDFTL